MREGQSVAGATQASSPRRKTIDDLDWARIEQAVAERLVGAGGRLFELPIASTAEQATMALRETAEVMALSERDETLPLEPLEDIRLALDQVERGGEVTAKSLYDVARTITTARAFRRFLAARRELLPTLAASCSTDPSLDDLADELLFAIDSDGTISDHASLELGRLREETANLRARIVARLEQMLHERAAVLQDQYYTLREDRYVLPVRADAHERVHGIVHGASSSGATVFVEPRELVTQGNRLKMAQAEMAREEARIVAALAESVQERLPSLRAAVVALGRADLRSASARLGHDLDAVVLELDPEPRIELHGARHPLLALDHRFARGVEDAAGGGVVPCDIALEAGHGLVLSGPNAGGKTVALKLLGLTALMMRAGLPVPARSESRCGFFESVLTDIGDEQSVTANLSTFSAHITNIAAILERCRRNALVLLDELAGGTDPYEGAALACALVDAICDRGAAVAVTTHYEGLKAHAAADPRLRNGAVGIDLETMEPTFDLAMDVPGASSALVVARRFGIPAAIVDAARGVLPEQSRVFEELAQSLRQEREAVARQREELATALRQAELAGKRAEEKAKAAEERWREVREKGRRELEAATRALSREIDAAQRRLRAARKDLERAELDAASLEAMRQTIGEARTTVERGLEASAKSEPSSTPHEARDLRDAEVEVGARVWVKSIGGEAIVVDKPLRGRVRVQAGPLRMTVPLAQLQMAAPSTPEPVASRGQVQSVETGAPKDAPKVADNTVDLRGLRVDDALSLLDASLDRLFGENAPTVYVVHGFGSGALKEAVRRHLEDDAHYVRSYRAGGPGEGGDGMTVVTLR